MKTKHQTPNTKHQLRAGRARCPHRAGLVRPTPSRRAEYIYPKVCAIRADFPALETPSPHDEGVGRGPGRGVLVEIDRRESSRTSSPRPSPPFHGGEGEIGFRIR